MTPTDPVETSPERQQTDESLRAEREQVDTALADHLAVFDEIADGVITQARARADIVLATARAKTDRLAATPPTVVKERAQADALVREERATADEVVREERAEQVVLLTTDREETDKDLVLERDHSDDALATRDEFLAIVSHDLRNLLHGVTGFAGLITLELTRSKFGEDVVKNAERIQRSGARMNRLIGDLVDVASIHAGTLAVHSQVGDPTEIVLEAVETFHAQAAKQSITVTTELVPPLLAAFDPPRVLQVLTNLLSNAIKFTPAKGKVVVRVERVGDELRFSVSDTGMGIPPGKLELIFDRYLQVASNDRRGVGLGLYISRCIIQGHGGKIWAESTLGAGSTFSFTLPATPPPLA